MKNWRCLPKSRYKIYWEMVQTKHFTAPQKMPNFQFSRCANWPWRDKILSAPQRGQEIIVNQSYSLDKAFNLAEFQAKLFFTRN